MLVLTRKNQEVIQIGNDIEVKVLGIEGEQVKIGIVAPKFVEIHRKEIFVAIQKQNSEAANVPFNVMNLIEQEPQE